MKHLKQYQKNRLANEIYDFILKDVDGNYHMAIWFQHNIAYLKPEKLIEMHKDMLSKKEDRKKEKIRAIHQGT